MTDRSTSETQILPRVLTAMLIGAAALFIAVYLFVALSRLAYPYDIQWMEGAMVDHARRILAGEPLYAAPTLEWTPYIYTPLYFYLSAGVSALAGPSIPALRLISFVASLGIFALLAGILRMETGRWLPGILGAGFFAATFSLSGAWFDLARNDTLFVCLTLAAIYAARFSPGMRGPLLAGILFAVAALTKQTALMLAAPLGLYYLLVNWRYFILFGAILGGLMGGSTLLFDALSDGWYSYYTFDLPGQHPWVMEMLVDYWRVDLLPVVIAGGFAGAYLLGAARRWWDDRRTPPDDLLFWGAVLGGALCAGWFSRLHEGGFINVLMPAFAGIALLFGLGAHHLMQGGNRRIRYGVLAAALLQFGLLIYNPLPYIPDSADRAAGDHLVRVAAAFDGDVLLVHRGFIAAQAGHDIIHANRMALEDVMRGTDDDIREMLAADIAAALAARRYDAIIFDGSRDDFILVDYYFDSLQDHYFGRGEVFNAEHDGAFWPKTGLELRPLFVFVPLAD